MALSSTSQLLGILVFCAVIEGMSARRHGLGNGAGKHFKKNDVHTSSSEFQCKTSGQNITSSLKCNGEADCEDKSDEADCHTRGKYWLPASGCPFFNEFVCIQSGYAIPQEWQCDGIVDCQDESDEFYCYWYKGEYMKKDLGESSLPEKKTSKIYCPVYSCPLYYTPCYFSGECIPDYYWCDDYVDCYDYSDEDYCYYKGVGKRRM